MHAQATLKYANLHTCNTHADHARSKGTCTPATNATLLQSGVSAQSMKHSIPGHATRPHRKDSISFCQSRARAQQTPAKGSDLEFAPESISESVSLELDPVLASSPEEESTEALLASGQQSKQGLSASPFSRTCEDL